MAEPARRAVAGDGRLRYDAVVLAGGGSTRLDGIDKTALVIGGLPLLDRVLTALVDTPTAVCGQVVVVGAARPTGRPVCWVQEHPLGGGPAAGLAAALPLLGAATVVVLAGDLPFLTSVTVDRLCAAVSEESGAVVLDETGAEQWLISAWPVELLTQAGLGAGRSLRATLGRLAVTGVPAVGREALDCDTPEDLDAARQAVAGPTADRIAR